MSYNHGITILENPTSVVPPIISETAVQVVVGTAPIHLAKDPYAAVNQPLLLNSFPEAVTKVGYSDDFENYSICQSIDASFRVFKVGPIVAINVLDPSVHTEVVELESLPVQKGEGVITNDGVLKDTLVVKDVDGVTLYENDVDYIADFNQDGRLVVSILKGGSITEATTELKVDYERLDSAKVTKEDIIGGYDLATNVYKGLEAIQLVYPKLGVVPGLILAPGWSQEPTVASVIDVKSEKINGCFNAANVLDVDVDAVTSYQDVPNWKATNSYTSKRSFVCYPKVKIGDKVYWYSAITAALVAYTDASNGGTPHKSPSNQPLKITGAVDGNGEDIFLDHVQANFLNGEGVFTAINMNGWRSWGNNTGAYPSTTDPKDRFMAIRRVFDWWGNTFTLTFLQKVDDPTNFRLIESIVDSENIRANGFQAKGVIAGAKIEFLEQDNPVTDILNGKIRFVQRIGAFPPAEHIVNVLEFDPTFLTNNLFGGE